MSNNAEKFIISGGGFHCKISIDLNKVKSIKRCAFWHSGWWYSCEYFNGKQVDIHVRESIDVIKLFEELCEQKSNRSNNND